MKTKLVIATLLGFLTGGFLVKSKANKTIAHQQHMLRKNAVIFECLLLASDGKLTEQEAAEKMQNDLDFLEITKKL